MERARLEQLADVLLPGTARMPRASEAEVSGHALEVVAEIRTDLLDEFRRGLIRPGPPERVLRELYSDDRDAFEALVSIISCAYSQNEKVRTSLGYPGQVPIGSTDRCDDWEDLLAPVKERGKIGGRWSSEDA